MAGNMGVDKVICTCGNEMVRTGGIFGIKTNKETYFCKQCNKAVNVYDLPEEEVNRMRDILYGKRTAAD